MTRQDYTAQEFIELILEQWERGGSERQRLKSIPRLDFQSKLAAAKLSLHLHLGLCVEFFCCSLVMSRNISQLCAALITAVFCCFFPPARGELYCVAFSCLLIHKRQQLHHIFMDSRQNKKKGDNSSKVLST